MDETYTIQQVAQQTGIKEHTLRYYEQIGLLDGVGRAANGHRRYTAEDLGRIDFLTKMRATGMSIRQMLQYVRSDTAERLRLLLAHQARVQARMDELNRIMSVMDYKINKYQNELAQRQPEQG